MYLYYKENKSCTLSFRTTFARYSIIHFLDCAFTFFYSLFDISIRMLSVFSLIKKAVPSQGGTAQ